MSRFDLNTKTKWGGWAKAVLMQEADLGSVANCCAAAALLEGSVADIQKEKDDAFSALRAVARELWDARLEGVRLGLEAAHRECRAEANDVANIDHVPMRDSSRVAYECGRRIRSLDAEAVAKEPTP